MQYHRKNISLIVLILAGEAVFFLPFVVARIFRPTLLRAFDITNTELGQWFSVYGIVAMVSYFAGGPLADRFDTRKLMALALWLTALGGFAMYFFPPNLLMKIIYGFWGFTTICLFWAALIRATREWGGDGFQGRAFGWLEGGRGATAALIGTASLLLFAGMLNDISVISQNRSAEAFRSVIFAISIFTGCCGVLVWMFIPESTDDFRKVHPSLKDVWIYIRKPGVWMLSVIILSAYVGYKITDVFALYAHEILNFSEVNSAFVGVGALWTRALVAVIAGILADKYSANTVIKYAFALSSLGGVLLSISDFEGLIGLALLNLSFVMIGVYGVRALYFALIDEGNFPAQFTGTVVGIVSVVGFTPDVFMTPWMGMLLDNNPGIRGHKLVFLVLASFAVLGLLATILYKRNNKKTG